jgi:hypothetical protein
MPGVISAIFRSKTLCAQMGILSPGMRSGHASDRVKDGTECDRHISIATAAAPGLICFRSPGLPRTTCARYNWPPDSSLASFTLEANIGLLEATRKAIRLPDQTDPLRLLGSSFWLDSLSAREATDATRQGSVQISSVPIRL